MYLYGASGHAKVIIDVLQAAGVKVDALFDDDPAINDLLSIPVLHKWNGESPVLVSVGNNVYRKQIAERLGCEFFTAQHPSAMVSPFASIGEGSVIMQGAIIQSDARVGRHCIINTGATIDHECSLGDYVHISPQATLCGNVHIGEGAWIGASAVVIPGVKVGRWSIVGAGSATITATQAASGSYAEQSKTFTVTVNQAALTVTAKNSSPQRMVFADGLPFPIIHDYLFKRLCSAPKPVAKQSLNYTHCACARIAGRFALIAAIACSGVNP